MRASLTVFIRGVQFMFGLSWKETQSSYFERELMIGLFSKEYDCLIYNLEKNITVEPCERIPFTF